MALNNGSFYSHGISFGATLQGSQIVPVFPTKATDAMRFILLVDGDGNAVVPEIVPAASGIDLGEGRVGGLKYTVVAVSELAALKARVLALENKLNGTTPIEETVTFERVIVHTIEARGTGDPPDPNIADLEIVTRHHALPNTYDQLFKVVGANASDMTPEPKISFFGTTAVGLRILPGGWTIVELQDALEAYRLVVE